MPDVKDQSVTVLGLGPMGRALAGAFLDAGLRTTVWNRTPGREGELTARGAVAAASVEEAVAASPLTVVCVVNYDAADTFLRREPVVAALRGRTVVNLSADTPGRARELANWASVHGISYLDGAIMTQNTVVGSPAGVFLYSGPTALYAQHRPVLEALNGTHTHLGDEIGHAAAYDIALLDIFWTTMAGYAHGLALARAEGVKAADLAPFAAGISHILPALFAQTAAETDAGDFTGSGADNPITSAASTMSHIVETSELHGIDASLMRAAQSLADRVITLGHGTDGFMRAAEVLGRDVRA